MYTKFTSFCLHLTIYNIIQLKNLKFLQVVEPGHDHTVAVELPLFFDSQNIIKPHPRQLKEKYVAHALFLL